MLTAGLGNIHTEDTWQLWVVITLDPPKFKSFCHPAATSTIRWREEQLTSLYVRDAIRAWKVTLSPLIPVRL